MARRIDFYKANRSTEPDMRFELNAMFDGLFPEIAKKQPVLLRKMRRDASGNLIQCECVDTLTGEPDKDKFCPFCFGEGYKWDELWIDMYSVTIRSAVGLASKPDLHSPGISDIEIKTFYFRSTVDITKKDRIIEVVLDSEGNVASPGRRAAVYHIGTLVDFRSDNGKLEYWKADCHEEQTKFLNGPEG